MTDKLLFVEAEPNYDLLKMPNAGVCTITNIPVKIDKVFYDLTGTTPIGVSGTLYIKGVKMRGVWDIMGNPMELKKTLSLNIKHQFINIDRMFQGCDKDMFRLVRAEEI